MNYLMSSSSKKGRGSSKTTKTDAQSRLPLSSSPQTDPILVGRLRALLADLEMDPGPAPMAEGSAPPPQDSTATILDAIERSRTSLLVRIDHLAEECNLIRNDLDKIRGRMTETESRVSATEDLTATHATSIAELQRTVQSLVAKSDDAENRLRRNNVRVLGLPEGEEGDHPAVFAEEFFKNLLGFTDVPPTYVVERAHRVPTGRVIPGSPPRPFLVRFLNYRDRDRILSEARKHPTLKHCNSSILLFPDFSADLQRKRKTFNDVRRRLRDKNIKYGMLYPSRLRVQHDGATRFFDNPADADDWLTNLR